jgi:hypothetical protein
MSQIRKKIEEVRSHWPNTDTYGRLVDAVRACCKPESLPSEVKEPLDRLLTGFRDYADIDFDRPEKRVGETYDALELYCSDIGHTYVYKLMAEALRSETSTEDQLFVATILVEFLTIDLYNLRLSQIGDPLYANFEGITYRGLRVKPEQVAEYEEIMSRRDLSKRGFAVPLALISSTSDLEIMRKFTDQDEESKDIRMQWTIHIHGIDPYLLETYRQRYPDSVVTSICAMPVARVAPISEKEILLRGAFFQLIAVRKSQVDGLPYVNLVMLMMNSNRDHTTEKGSNEGEKKLQRDAFARIVAASKFEACAVLAAEYSTADAEGYKSLARNKMAEIQNVDHLDVDLDWRINSRDESDQMAVWLGGVMNGSYPKSYHQARQAWQEAIHGHKWNKAVEQLTREYEWRQGEWYNVVQLDKLARSQVTSEEETYTLLHILASSPPPNPDDDSYTAWKYLVDGIEQPGVFSKIPIVPDIT